MLSFRPSLRPLIFRIVILLFLGIWEGVFGLNNDFGHSTLVLYKGGKERFELDGKSCPVGVAFKNPETFSCGCVNGIWAFYMEPCTYPVAIIGGQNHCFQIPVDLPLSLITSISSPMRASTNSLTAFEEGMTSVRTKMFRNAHMRLENISNFVTINSSWTLLTGEDDKKEEVCLDNRKVTSNSESIFGDLREQFKVQPMFCLFSNVSSLRISGFRKGCSAQSKVFLPEECLPILPRNSEEICRSEIPDPVDTAMSDKNDLDLFRFARADNELEEGSKTGPKPVKHYFQSNGSMPKWLQLQGANPSTPLDEEPPKETQIQKSDSDIKQLISVEYSNLTSFLQPPPTKSNLIVKDQVWKHERRRIRDKLKITTPEELALTDIKTQSKSAQLLLISKDIMKLVCPLENDEFFDVMTDVFLQIQEKVYRWKEDYVRTLDFKRIQAALMACRESATPIIPSSQTCNIAEEGKYAELPIPKVLNSDGYEPIVETAWKIIVATHSYCYKDFSHFYNDHHIFTTVILPLFTNEVHNLWFSPSNETGSMEYAGIMGDTVATLRRVDQCTYGSRLISSYPFHLTRPSIQVKYDDAFWRRFYALEYKVPVGNEDEDVKIGQVRKKRQVNSQEGQNQRLEDSSGSPQANNPGSLGIEKDAWKKERTIMSGIGFCLKKYNEPKLHLGQDCDIYFN